MLWKIPMVQIKEIYDLLISRKLFPEEQKGCCEWIGGTRELLYIDQTHPQGEQDDSEITICNIDDTTELHT